MGLQSGCASGCTTEKTVCDPCDASTGVCCHIVVVKIPCNGSVSNLTDNFAGAITFGAGNTLGSLDIIVDGSPVAINSNIDSNVRALIADSLIAQGAFDPHSQHIQYFTTIQPATIMANSVIQVNFAITRPGGGRVVGDRVGFGATAERFLKPGITPDDFFAFSENVAAGAGISASSWWSLLGIAMALAGVGYFLLARVD